MKIIYFAITGLFLCFISCNNQNTSRSLPKSDTSTASLKTEIYSEALQSEAYKNAWMEVQQLKENVRLADSSLLNRDDVIREFNSGIGRTMGVVKKISQVKEKLKNIDSTYLKFVALKVAAQIALQKAANSNSEAEKLKNQK